MQSGGLFGPTSNQVARQIREKGRANDIALASSPRGTGGKLLALGVGRGIGDAIAGDRSDDPEVMRARKLQTVKNQVAASGLSPAENTEEFLELTSKFMVQQGLMDEAFKVSQGLNELRLKKVKSENETLKAQAAGATAEIAGFKELRLQAREGLETDKLLAQTEKLRAEVRKLDSDDFGGQTFGSLPPIARLGIITTKMRNDAALLARFGGKERLAQFEDAIRKIATRRGIPSDIAFRVLSKVEAGGLEVTDENDPNFLTTGEREVWNIMKKIGILGDALGKGIPGTDSATVENIPTIP